jgi:hypothetical protein
MCLSSRKWFKQLLSKRVYNSKQGIKNATVYCNQFRVNCSLFMWSLTSLKKNLNSVLTEDFMCTPVREKQRCWSTQRNGKLNSMISCISAASWPWNYCHMIELQVHTVHIRCSLSESRKQGLEKGWPNVLNSEPKTKLRCLSPRANYTDRGTAVCRRS